MERSARAPSAAARVALMTGCSHEAVPGVTVLRNPLDLPTLQRLISERAMPSPSSPET